nr:hypothetical protein [Tanacetum cinerariifolium]
MGDEHLDTTPEMESDKVIKSSFENLIPNPSESEDECECDVPDCDDSQAIIFSTFSNPLFDDSTSSDDELSHEEVIHEMSFKTYSNPLYDLDEEIISSEFNPIHNKDLDSTLKNDRFDTESYLLESLLNRDTLIASSLKIDSLLDELAGELIFLKSIPSGIDEANCDPEEDIHFVERLLYDNSSPRPPKEFNSKNSDAIIESFSSSPIPLRIVTLLWRRSICFLLLMDQYPRVTDIHKETKIRKKQNRTKPSTGLERARENESNGATQQLGSGNSFALTVAKYSSSRIFITGSGNDLKHFIPNNDDELSHEEVIHEMIFKTYSNPLYDLDEEIISSEFNSIHNKDLDSTPKNDRFDTESYLLESLLNRDTLMASSLKIDSLLDELAGELIFLKPIPSGIDEANYDPVEDIHFVERLLYDNSSPRPLKEFNSKNSDAIIESFSPSPILLRIVTLLWRRSICFLLLMD